MEHWAGNCHSINAEAILVATVFIAYIYNYVSRMSSIHSGDIYSTASRNLLKGALSPATAKEKCLKKLAEGRHVVPGKHAQRKMEFIRSGGANHRERSMMTARTVLSRTSMSEEKRK